MLETLKSLLMIGSPTQTDGPLWPILLAGALAYLLFPYLWKD